MGAAADKRADLEAQIAKEAEELANAPKLPVYVGPMRRCHFCGAIAPLHELTRAESHVQPRSGGHRVMCKNCRGGE